MDGAKRISYLHDTMPRVTALDVIGWVSHLVRVLRYLFRNGKTDRSYFFTIGTYLIISIIDDGTK